MFYRPLNYILAVLLVASPGCQSTVEPQILREIKTVRGVTDLLESRHGDKNNDGEISYIERNELHQDFIRHLSERGLVFTAPNWPPTADVLSEETGEKISRRELTERLESYNPE